VTTPPPECVPGDRREKLIDNYDFEPYDDIWPFSNGQMALTSDGTHVWVIAWDGGLALDTFRKYTWPGRQLIEQHPVDYGLYPVSITCREDEVYFIGWPDENLGGGMVRWPLYRLNGGNFALVANIDITGGQSGLGIGYARANDRLYLWNPGSSITTDTSTLIEVDPVTGNYTQVANLGLYSEPDPTQPVITPDGAVWGSIWDGSSPQSGNALINCWWWRYKPDTGFDIWQTPLDEDGEGIRRFSPATDWRQMVIPRPDNKVWFVALVTPDINLGRDYYAFELDYATRAGVPQRVPLLDVEYSPSYEHFHNAYNRGWSADAKEVAVINDTGLHRIWQQECYKPPPRPSLGPSMVRAFGEKRRPSW
jgi:hypothetical protein